MSFFSSIFGILATLAVLALPIASQAIIQNPVINLCQSPGQFAMTFDQGPSIYTGTLLDALDSRSVKGTFHPVVTYLGEAVVVANLQRAASSGHAIGLSIEPSIDLSSMSDDDIMSTIDSRAQQISSITGSTPVFLRLPNYLNMSITQLNMIISKGYIITTYNLDSYDYQTTDVLGSFQAVLNLLSPNTKGAFISVQRDYIETSVDATPQILDYIISKGYTLVTLDQCVRMPANNTSSAPATSNGQASAGGSSSVKQQSDASTSKDFINWTIFAAVAIAALVLH